jgi:hypothetical protein
MEEAARLRQEAAHARRLAKTIPGDPASQRLDQVARELEAQADSLDGEPPGKQ